MGERFAFGVRNECCPIAIEWAASQVGRFGQIVRQLRDGVHTAAQPRGHDARLTANGTEDIGGFVVRFCRENQPHTWDVPQRDAEQISVSVLCPRELKHGLHRLPPIEFRPAPIGIGQEDINLARKAGNLIGQGNDTTAAAPPHFQTAQGFTPPTSKRSMRVFPSTDRCNQPATAEQKEVSITNPFLGLTQGDVKSQWHHHAALR